MWSGYTFYDVMWTNYTFCHVMLMNYACCDVMWCALTFGIYVLNCGNGEVDGSVRKIALVR